MSKTPMPCTMYKSRRLALAALVAGLVLTGCSSVGNEQPFPTPGAPTVGDAAFDQDPAYTNSQQIVAKLNAGGYACTHWQVNESAFGSRDAGACMHGKREIRIYMYTSRRVQNQIAEGFEDIRAGVYHVTGDRWEVTVDTDAQAKAVQAIVGGLVQ